MYSMAVFSHPTWCEYDYVIFQHVFLIMWFSFQLSELVLSALNQNLVQFTLRPGVQVTVYAAHLSAGNALQSKSVVSKYERDKRDLQLKGIVCSKEECDHWWWTILIWHWLYEFCVKGGWGASQTVHWQQLVCLIFPCV